MNAPRSTKAGCYLSTYGGGGEGGALQDYYQRPFETASQGSALRMLTNEATLFSMTSSLPGVVQGGNNSHFVFYGKQATAEACMSACANDAACIAWTWHDADQPAPVASWDEQCYGVLKGTTPSAVTQTHHLSGTKTFTIPQNVYVARNVRGVPAGMTGQ